MKKKEKRIFIITGEPSGDLHASNLGRSLKEMLPNIKLSGMGGEKMRQAGVDTVQDITSLAVIGFVEVFKNLVHFRRVFNLLTKELDRQKPDVVVLVDYPGFNLKFAKEVKKRGIPLIYYISPQIWAWGKGRIKTIKKLVDKMIVLFKFEEELYKKASVPVVFVGHPLLDNLKKNEIKNLNNEKITSVLDLNLSSNKTNSAIESKNVHSDNLVIGLLPGSRKGEVQRILPIMLRTGEIIFSQLKNAHFLLSMSSNVSKNIYQQIIKKSSLSISFAETNECFQQANLLLICSGTATLEATLYQKPMLVIYKTSFLTALLAKLLIKIPYIALINIAAGEKVVPEFIQYKAKPQRIAKKAIELIRDKHKREKVKEKLRKAALNLGESGASKRAAEIICGYLAA